MSFESMLFSITSAFAWPVLLITLTAIIALLGFHFREFFAFAEKQGKKQLFLLLVVFVFAFLFRFLGASCPAEDAKLWHYVSVSEIFLEAGTPEIGYPLGYSFLLSLISIFGRNLAVIEFVNSLFSALTCVLVFLIVFVSVKKWKPAFFSSLIFSLLPISVFYSKYGSPETLALFFSTASLFFLLYWVDKKKFKSLVLSGLLLVFAISLRLENSVFVPVFLGFVALQFRSSNKKEIVFALGIFFVALLQLSAFYVHGVDKYGYGFTGQAVEKTGFSGSDAEEFFASNFPDFAGQGSFSLLYVLPTLSVNLEILFSPFRYPLLLFPFVLLGLFAARKNRFLAIVAIWTFAAVLFYLLFWLGLITNQEIQQLMILPAFAVFAGTGIYWFFFEFAGFSNGKKPVVFAVVIFVIFALFFLTGIFSQDAEFNIFNEETCLLSEARQHSLLLQPGSCIVASDEKYSLGSSNMLISLYSFPSFEVKQHFFDCVSSPVYFFDLNSELIPPFSPQSSRLKDLIESNCSMDSISKSDKFSFYLLDCPG